MTLESIQRPVFPIMDHQLHQRALDCAEEDLIAHSKSKPTAYLVGILWHDNTTPITDVQRENFMFLKCTSRTSIHRLRESYVAKLNLLDVSLSLGPTILADITKISELDAFSDKVIVLRAIGSEPAGTNSDNTPASTIPIPQSALEQPNTQLMEVPGALTPERQASISSRASVDYSGLPTASSVRAPSVSSQTGYTPSPRSTSDSTKSIRMPASARALDSPTSAPARIPGASTSIPRLAPGPSTSASTSMPDLPVDHTATPRTIAPISLTSTSACASQNATSPAQALGPATSTAARALENSTSPAQAPDPTMCTSRRAPGPSISGSKHVPVLPVHHTTTPRAYTPISSASASDRHPENSTSLAQVPSAAPSTPRRAPGPSTSGSKHVSALPVHHTTTPRGYTPLSSASTSDRGPEDSTSLATPRRAPGPSTSASKHVPAPPVHHTTTPRGYTPLSLASTSDRGSEDSTSLAQAPGSTTSTPRRAPGPPASTYEPGVRADSLAASRASALRSLASMSALENSTFSAQAADSTMSIPGPPTFENEPALGADHSAASRAFVPKSSTSGSALKSPTYPAQVPGLTKSADVARLPGSTDSKPSRFLNHSEPTYAFATGRSASTSSNVMDHPTLISGNASGPANSLPSTTSRAFDHSNSASAFAPGPLASTSSDMLNRPLLTSASASGPTTSTPTHASGSKISTPSRAFDHLTCASAFVPGIAVSTPSRASDHSTSACAPGPSRSTPTRAPGSSTSTVSRALDQPNSGSFLYPRSSTSAPASASGPSAPADARIPSSSKLAASASGSSTHASPSSIPDAVLSQHHQVLLHAQRHNPSSAYYGQAPGSPFVGDESLSGPTQHAHVPYASHGMHQPPSAWRLQPVQASPSLQGSSFGLSHDAAQDMSNGTSHGLSFTQMANTQPEIKPEIPLPAPLIIQPVEDEDEDMGQAGSSPADENGDDDPALSQDMLPITHLQAMAKANSAEKLEAGVKQGISALDSLAQSFELSKETADAEQWLRQIELVRQEATGARTVVGVVGNTGAGKSSVINAILDEERLVPTNCMRACTAVVTEMSWNPSEEESSKYRAEIEFIKPDEWQKELRVLFNEIFDGGGNISREVSNPESQAGIAYAKIRAVYWRLTNDDLAASSIEKLMADRCVRGVLGTTKYLKERYCDTFYKGLQHYVDSREKAGVKNETDDEDDSQSAGDKKKKKTRKREQEFWPLIKVVRLYVKADALSTGAVLVDLPGVADSNAARAAVAERYMKQCTGLWIVSPINRAVDDKAAKNLLGSTFRRQLKYDGTYSAVTFICSKTEATDSLDLGDEIDRLEDQLTAIDRRRREADKEAKKLRDQKGSLSETMDTCDDEVDRWEALKEKLDDGETVYPPAPKTLKRKRSSSSTDSEDDGNSSDDSDHDSDRGPPLTAEDIDSNIRDLKDQKKQARRGRSEIELQVKQINSEIKQMKIESRSIDDKRTQICIAARNRYSKSAIQIDFAAGIKEVGQKQFLRILDQEAEAEDDPDQYDPEQEIRDYEKVAKDLPVFCVSSRAYQKLSGRLLKDNAVRGFTDVNQTEIPALKKHCKMLTENVRSIKSRRFLNSLCRLLTSVSLYNSDYSSGASKSDLQKDSEQRFLARQLQDLEKALEKDVKDTLTQIREAMNENVFENCNTAINAASNTALPTSQGWGAHKSQGGLPWSTYKAVVRRQGVWTGSLGLSDFNAQLTEPVYKILGNGWEKAFHRRLPQILKACSKGFANDLRAFHTTIEKHSFSHGGNPRLGLLAQQLTNYEAVFSDLANRMVDLINERQRDINREFTPNVCNSMLTIYNTCAAEVGPGQFNRMKAYMNNHVTAQKDIMFQRATEVVRNMITDLIKEVEDNMEDRTDQVFVGMGRDYLQVLGNVRIEDITMPNSERSLQDAIRDIIQQSEEVFKAILEGRDVPSLEQDVSAGAIEDEQQDSDTEKKGFEKDQRDKIMEDTSSDVDIDMGDDYA
ncbi:hypothetical protein D6C91_07788 [Aureobasidium pullulans]|uniref:P-loop containing nucleoside triphosphate hydrolase protein n=1 Tax=Aureobasidium pullulans TaxID=5580 RepID=A0A4S9SPD6_AURPU|nr:hypothetical protein D6C91_07788 [Aureobasidium pullulans]